MPKTTEEIFSNTEFGYLDDPLIANLVDGVDYYDAVATSAFEIACRLRFHCGPYASHAVIPSPMGSANKVIDQYTKDGITIVNAWRTESVTAEYLKRLTAYIGSRVDSACHDGTTTSMMLFVLIVNNLFLLIKHDSNLQNRLPELSKSLQTTLGLLEAEITQSAVSVEDLLFQFKTTRPDTTLSEVRKAVAYQQALVASKGDTELATIISNVLITVPVELYGQYIIRSNEFETKSRFEMETQAYHISLISNLLIIGQNNHALGTELLLEDCDLLITYSPMIQGVPALDAVLALFSLDHENREFYGMEPGEQYITKPLVLLVPSASDGRLFEAINFHNLHYPDAMIYPIMYIVSPLMQQMYATGLCAMSMVPELTTAFNIEGILKCIIRGAKVSHRKSTLLLYNLYQKTDGIYHPAYENPTRSLFYTQTLMAVQAVIENTTKKHIATLADKDLNEAITLYRTMTCQTICDVKLGGTTHDMIANRSVVEDAIGSAVSSLSDGMVFGGHLVMFRLLDRMLDDPLIHDFDKNSVVMSIGYALAHVLSTIYCFPSESSYLQVRRTFYDKTDDKFDFYVMGNDRTIEKQNLLNMVDEFLSCSGQRVLLQPLAGYSEQLRRMQGILPNLVNSTCLIDTSYVPGESRLSP